MSPSLLSLCLLPPLLVYIPSRPTLPLLYLTLFINISISKVPLIFIIWFLILLLLLVFGCKVGQPVSEQKPEGKKSKLNWFCCTCKLFFKNFLALNFIKPKIEVLPESEFSLSSFPRPLPPPPPPPFVPTSSGEEALAAKHEFQSKLTGAIQQLSPSVPSLLVCTVQAADNTW